MLWGQIKKTEVLVFGTAHLAQMNGFENRMLDSVIAKLDEYKFDVICIEKIPGILLYDIKSRDSDTFEGIINGRWGKPYLSIADTVQKVYNMSFLDAQKTVATILKQDSITIKDREALFHNYLANTDIPSAALQYKYLDSINYSFSDFDYYLISQIKKEMDTNSEFYSIALPIALHCGNNKIDAINDFQDEALLFDYFPDFANDCQSRLELLSGISELPVYKKMKELTIDGIESKDLSSLFSFLNSDIYKIQDLKGQWEVWFETKFDSGSDRARYSLWEMRNLQITANLLKVIARNSGNKVLVIIGASHVSFIEKYLNQIPDIEMLVY